MMMSQVWAGPNYCGSNHDSFSATFQHTVHVTDVSIVSVFDKFQLLSEL